MMGESKMTTNEYLAALKRLGLTQTSKATQEGLGVTSRQLTRYSNGVTSVPPMLERLLTALIKLVAASRQTLLFATSSGNL